MDAEDLLLEGFLQLMRRHAKEGVIAASDLFQRGSVRAGDAQEVNVEHAQTNRNSGCIKCFYCLKKLVCCHMHRIAYPIGSGLLHQWLTSSIRGEPSQSI